MVRRSDDQAAGPARVLDRVLGVVHDHPQARVEQHGQVVVAVPDGHHVIHGDPVFLGDELDGDFLVYVGVHGFDPVRVRLDEVETGIEPGLQVRQHRLAPFQAGQDQHLGRRRVLAPSQSRQQVVVPVHGGAALLLYGRDGRGVPVGDHAVQGAVPGHAQPAVDEVEAVFFDEVEQVQEGVPFHALLEKQRPLSLAVRAEYDPAVVGDHVEPVEERPRGAEGLAAAVDVPSAHRAHDQSPVECGFDGAQSLGGGFAVGKQGGVVLVEGDQPDFRCSGAVLRCFGGHVVPS